MNFFSQPTGTPDSGDDDNSLDIDLVIRSCIHTAVAMLKDSPNELRQRKTHRLQLLLSLLGDADGTEISEIPFKFNHFKQLIQDYKQIFSYSKYEM